MRLLGLDARLPDLRRPWARSWSRAIPGASSAPTTHGTLETSSMTRAAVLAALLVLAVAPAVAHADVSAQEAVQIVKQESAARTLLLSHPGARFTAQRAAALARDRGRPFRAHRSRAGSSIARAVRSAVTRRPRASADSRTPR
jgi:hypothetical protein